MRLCTHLNKRGFNIIELMVVVAVGVILVGFTITNLAGKKNRSDLNSATQKITALLREAQSRSITQASGTQWSVHFDNVSTPFFALFPGTTYATSTSITFSRLPANVCFATSSIPQGGRLDETFAINTGLPSTSTVITLQLSTNCNGSGAILATSSVTITPIGLIQ